MLQKCYFVCPLCLCVEIYFWTAEYKLYIYRYIYVGKTKINSKIQTTVKQTKKEGVGGGGDKARQWNQKTTSMAH